MEYLDKLTAEKLIYLQFEMDHDEVPFQCAHCEDTIGGDSDLVTPCHPTTGFAEGSGHGGVDGMAIFCALNEPIEDQDGNLTSYCGWGGSLREYIPQLLCSQCLESPFLSEGE